jgi:hypothetical protein
MASWMDGRVAIPRGLRELHGESSSRGELVLVYGGGLILAALALRLGRLELAGLEAWKIAIVALLALDISGGVLANLTPGTRSYWGGRGLPARAGFIALHALHPFLLWLAFPQYLGVLALAWAWVALSFALVTFAGKGPAGELVAMLLSLLGTALLVFVWATGFIVTFLLVEYFFKLVFGFSPGRRAA